MFLLFNFWHKVFPGKNYNPTLVKQTVKLLKKATDEYPPPPLGFVICPFPMP